MRIIKGAILLFVLLLAGSTAARADGLTFTLSLIPPSGNINGAPGSTIGWGYVITNNSTTDFLQAGFNLNGGIFLNTTSSSPDFSIFNFPLVGPGQTVTVPFVPLVSGFAELTWNSNAPSGFVNSGIFDLGGSLFCTSSAFSSCTIAAPDETAAYSATVSTPEPESLFLLGAGLSIMFMFRKRFLRMV